MKSPGQQGARWTGAKLDFDSNATARAEAPPEPLHQSTVGAPCACIRTDLPNPSQTAELLRSHALGAVKQKPGPGRSLMRTSAKDIQPERLAGVKQKPRPGWETDRGEVAWRPCA
jgi:hypothetical protein